MKVVVTGAGGFLGWHTRVRLKATSDHEVIAIDRSRWDDLDSAVSDADVVLHLAGVNRGTDDEVEDGNARLAADLAQAVKSAERLTSVVYANSIQAGNDSPYGRGKAQAARILAGATESVGVKFADLRLPNLFGEHGRPGYNSFVATFVRAAIDENPPTVQDREVGLLHVQRAAASIISAINAPPDSAALAPTLVSVQGVWDRLEHFHRTYPRTGDLPDLTEPFDVDLFNTYRAGLFPSAYPIALVPRSDDRGRLVEAVRAHGGPGQTFVSTTRPGVTRGEHFHLRKIERFAVLAGRARISLRKCLTDELVEFDVDGKAPAVVDMPTMWSHNITNVGDTELLTLFWVNELFDPDAPDTHPEPVNARS